MAYLHVNRKNTLMKKTCLKKYHVRKKQKKNMSVNSCVAVQPLCSVESIMRMTVLDDKLTRAVQSVVYFAFNSL